jgi:hypothetical protein
MTLELLCVNFSAAKDGVAFIFWEGLRRAYTAMTAKELRLEFGAIV